MTNKNFGPQYLTADGRFTKERPNWMRPKGCEVSPDLSEYSPKDSSQIAKKNYPQSKLSDAAAQKIADALHIMLNDKT